MQRHATPAPLPIPIETTGRSDDTEARAVSQLAAKLPAHQSSPGHGQDCRADNTYQTSTLSPAANSGSAESTAPLTKCCTSLNT
ncbi:hypothetical protein Trydic_g16201 [Trypoxylus dichotomus]